MLEKDPGDDFLNYALALELDASGNKEKAIEQLKALLSSNENYLGAYYKLGQLLEQNGQSNEALEIYNKGLEIAEMQKNRKTAGELREAIWLLEDE